MHEPDDQEIPDLASEKRMRPVMTGRQRDARRIVCRSGHPHDLAPCGV